MIDSKDVVTGLREKYEALEELVAQENEERKKHKINVKNAEYDLKKAKSDLYHVTRDWVKAKKETTKAYNKWKQYLSKIRRDVKKKPALALKMFEGK